MLLPLLDPALLQLPVDRLPTFAWDETNVQQYFYYSRRPMFERFDCLSNSANIALAFGVCEWIEAWLVKFDNDLTLEKYIEAAWAGLLDRGYTTHFSIDADEWRGPVRGAMVIALGIVNEVLFESHDEPRMAFRSSYAINMARHVMGHYESFESWLESVLRRLEVFHTKSLESFADVDILAFEFPRGELVAREALILSYPYDPLAAQSLIQSQMERIRDQNPFFDRDASAEHQF